MWYSISTSQSGPKLSWLWKGYFADFWASFPLRPNQELNLRCNSLLPISGLQGGRTIFAMVNIIGYFDGLLQNYQYVYFRLIHLGLLQNLARIVPKVMVFFQISPYLMSLFCLV